MGSGGGSGGDAADTAGNANSAAAAGGGLRRRRRVESSAAEAAAMAAKVPSAPSSPALPARFAARSPTPTSSSSPSPSSPRTSQSSPSTSTSTSATQCSPPPPPSPPSSLPPRGSSLFPTVWHRDPSRPALKAAIVSITVLGLTALPFVPDWIVANLSHMDGSWDAHHGHGGYMYGTSASDRGGFAAFATALHGILDASLGLDRSCTSAAFWVTVGFYAGLVLLDLVLHNVGGWLLPVSMSDGSKSAKMASAPYPRSWNVDNVTCYEDMFSEPTRYGRLLRHPGNSVSNAPYLFGALCVLLSCSRCYRRDNNDNSGSIGRNDDDIGSNNNIFLHADAVFGLLLLVLAASSTVWHMSNAPLSHYVDLWSMDGCILYLLLRSGCLGALRLVSDHLPSSTSTTLIQPDALRTLAGWVCLLLFSSILFVLARVHHANYKSRFLHSTCPFSCRARLSGMSDVFGRGHLDVGVGTVCAYAALPVFYAAVPTMVLLYVGCAGSLTMARVTFGTLVVGWTYRMFERWTLDGCLPLEAVLRLDGGGGGGGGGALNVNIERRAQRDDNGPYQKATTHSQAANMARLTSVAALRTVGAAVVSPTAVLHALTGVTLLVGYAHARSVDGAAAW